MERFVVFDVETPNENNDRMSAIGIAVVDNGKITGTYDTLINPETYFNPWNTALTGITEEDASKAPVFNEIWDEIEPILSDGILIAHNAPFDLSVLAKCLRAYCIDWERYVRYACTVRMGRKALPNLENHRLNTLCSYWGIPLEHHRADSDSVACARLLIEYQKSNLSISSFLRVYDLWKMRTLKKGEFPI